MNLESLGWDTERDRQFESLREEGLEPARVAAHNRDAYDLFWSGGELRGVATGKMFYLARGPSDLPAVGDWVAVRPAPANTTAAIHEILPRRSCFMRKAAGEKDLEQVIAANVDRLFLVAGLDGEFNRRRIERYLAAASESGAEPVLVLNKSDAAVDAEGMRAEAAEAAGSRTVVEMSARTGAGLEQLFALLPVGTTGALTGSSGVGKTTIINRLLGSDTRPTEEVRASDHRGRHTTARRELIPIPGGGALIDTPGMRELGLWGGTEGVAGAFPEIEELAANCRFRDCSHESEPDCAVLAAVNSGQLSADRLLNYRKLLREAVRQEGIIDKRVASELRKEWARLQKTYRKLQHRRTKG